MLRTAVVGLGMGLGFHIPKIVNNNKYELVAIVDVNAEKLNEISSKYKVPGYEDIYKMMDTVRPDLVVIASPTQFHAPHSIGAMERGIDVFLEKPMAKDLTQAKTIYEVQKRTGRKLMIYQPHRTFNEVITAKSIIESGILGKLHMITRSMRTYFIRTSWQAYKENGGGTLNNHGSHFIDLMLYLSKGNPEKVSCEVQRILATGDADDCAKVLIKTDNGVILDINMSLASTIKSSDWEIYGDRGTAVLVEPLEGKPFFRARYILPDAELKQQTYHPCVIPSNKEKVDQWIIEDFLIGEERYGIDIYDKCYEYYALGKEPFVAVEDTLKVMEVLEKCHADSQV